MRQFQVGDRNAAMIDLTGYVTTIRGVCSCGPDCYVVDMELHDGAYLKVAGSALQLVYDGDDPASWSDCVWKPAGVAA